MTSATKNSFWYLGFNLCRLVILFAGSIWISRVLGPETFGQFSYFLSLIVYLSSLDSLCHESVIKQEISKSSDVGLVMGTASLLCFLLTAMSCLAIISFGFLTVADHALLLTVLFFIPAQINKPLNPIANYFDINLLSKYSSFALFAGALVSVAFRVVSLGFSRALVFQSLGYSLQTLIYGGVLYFFYRTRMAVVSWRVSWALLGELVRKSLPIFLSAIVYLSLSQSDIIMIRYILNVREVGIYSMVVKLSEPWVIVSSALCASYFPLVFKQRANPKKQEKYFVLANQLSIYFVGSLGIVLTLSIGEIVAVLLGPQYAEVASVFRIYFWGILFLYFANIQHIWEVFHEKYSIALKKALVACSIKITLNFLLGELLGLRGFALSSLISLGFYGWGFNFFSRTTHPYLRMQRQAFGRRESVRNYRFFIQKGRRWLKRRY